MSQVITTEGISAALRKNPNDKVAQHWLGFYIIMQVLEGLNDASTAYGRADRLDLKAIEKKHKEEGRAPFIRFSDKDEFLGCIQDIHSPYVESLGISGRLQARGESPIVEVTYDFSAGQPTKATIALFPYSRADRAQRIISQIPAHIMPKGKWTQPYFSLEKMLKLGDFADAPEIVDAAVLRGYIKYGGKGKPFREVHQELVNLSGTYKPFTPKAYFLRINNTNSHHNPSKK